MIQFNLLPDVKLDYIKARRNKQIVIVLSSVVSGAALALLILMFLVVNVAQKQHLNRLNNDIAASKKELQEKPELAKILTIQNQLNSLTALHEQKPVVSRTVTYIQQVTPAKASIATVTINFVDQTMKIEGATDTLATVNTFVDTLKFTTFTATGEDNSSAATNTPAFSEVVLADFGVSTLTAGQNPDRVATYGITLKYNPLIFSDANVVKLVVASRVTTRSETEKPSAIFQTNSESGAGQ